MSFLGNNSTSLCYYFPQFNNHFRMYYYFHNKDFIFTRKLKTGIHRYYFETLPQFIKYDDNVCLAIANAICELNNNGIGVDIDLSNVPTQVSKWFADDAVTDVIHTTDYSDDEPIPEFTNHNDIIKATLFTPTVSICYPISNPELVVYYNLKYKTFAFTRQLKSGIKYDTFDTLPKLYKNVYVRSKPYVSELYRYTTYLRIAEAITLLNVNCHYIGGINLSSIPHWVSKNFIDDKALGTIKWSHMPFVYRNHYPYTKHYLPFYVQNNEIIYCDTDDDDVVDDDVDVDVDVDADDDVAETDDSESSSVYDSELSSVYVSESESSSVYDSESSSVYYSDSDSSSDYEP